VNDQFKKGNFAVVPQKVLAEVQHEPSSSSTMTTYIGAVNEFTRNATAFIEQLPLLTKARDAYEQAMRAGAELRKVLDAGEENLRTFEPSNSHDPVGARGEHSTSQSRSRQEEPGTGESRKDERDRRRRKSCA
jgi:hypothetical protein